MNDITIYGSKFEECLFNLEEVLNRCVEKDLVLNWEKRHFMVQQGSVLGHIISEKGIGPLVCTHHIYMEEEAKPICQPQRRLNPHMQEVVQAEVLKLL